MTRHLQFICATACIWLFASAQTSLDKWSRQVEATEPGISDSFDWIPVAQPADSGSKDRVNNGRVLTYSQSFPPNARFGELGKPSLSQKPTPFEFPYPFQNFANPPQTQSLRQSNLLLKSQEPTSQSFFKFEMPLSQQNARPSQLAGPGVNTGYQISHAFGGGAQATLFNSPLYNQQPVFPPEFHPIPQKPLTQQLQQKPLSQQNVIEDPLSLKNFFKENKPLPTQTSSLQAVTPQVFPDPNADTPYSLRSPYNTLPSAPAPSAPSSPQDSQFLYVPYNDIYNLGAPQAQPAIQQQQQQPQNPFEQPSKFNPNLPTVNPYQINQFYTPDPVGQPQHNIYTTSTTVRPQTTSPSNVYQNFITNNQFTTVTPKPKPKAHQPPLSMFLLRTTTRPAQNDVVDVLASAKTIAVIDAPTSNTPEIFVGPGGMPIPNGYTKFELPYLSQLQNSGQDISDVPYFVAPLSYRTPGGFKKILLPEPHVGSIVINLAKSTPPAPPSTPPPVVQQPNLYYQPQIQELPTTTHRPRTSTQRVKSNGATPNRGNKFSYYFDQEPIQEVSSPQIHQKDRPKKKRPQSSKIEQTIYPQQLNNPYAQFNPIPNHITSDDYYKLATKPSTTSSTSTTTSTTSTTTTTSTTAAPQTYFSYNTQAQVEFPGSSGHLYHDINQVAPQPQEEKPRLTTRPPVGTTAAEEEYRMKQYYRQQDAIRNRPKIVPQPNAAFEQVQYTPVNLEYEVSPKTTTVKPRITFFSPTAEPVPEEEYNTLPARQQSQQPENNNNLPANHRPAYTQNEITDSPVEYEPNPYQLPSELPPLTPNLPGLVNNLKDMKEQEKVAEQTTFPPTTYEQETTTRPTRRPINRVRKPTKASVTENYVEPETVTRRPVNRVRRPFGTRNNVASAITTNLETESATASPPTTRRPTFARNPLVRNPNRVRYQPTAEERQTLRIKNKKKYGSSSKAADESEDLDYQRDVLKQNYPVFRPNAPRKPSSPTAIPTTYEITTTEAPTSETQQVYTVTPSNNIDNNDQIFPAGLLEPMQIAQQYNQYKDNYGPGYFPNQEDLNPTEPVVKNEVNPVYTTIPSTTPPPAPTTTTTTTTTTTEAPVVITTRRSPFIRRNYPRVRTTTTEAPITTTPLAEEKPAIRHRLPPRKVIKVRTRNRRPLHPASSTAAPQEEENYPTEEPKQNYRKVNRYNQDAYENETPRRRYKSKFQLEGQESQWSPAVKFGPTNNFKPVHPKLQTINKHKFEDEPEIVTVGPEAETKDNYEIKVSANFGPSAGNGMKPQLKEPNLKPEKSFAELLEEVMGKAPEEKAVESTTEASSSSSDGTLFESQKTTIANRLNRRGKWKKTRIVPTHNNGETFETAESQNLGSQLYNTLQKAEKSPEAVDLMRDWKTTTPMTTAAEINAMSTTVTTTAMPMNSVEEYGMTTSKSVEATTIAPTMPMEMEETMNENVEENATRRMDDTAAEEDLEIQPSLFSEVKKQLHELFSIEEGDDTAVTAALAAVGKRRQEYTNIKRAKVETTTLPGPDFTEPMSVEDKKAFHRELMKHVVYATSSPVKEEETSEAEICYRGRCIKSEDLPANHKLN